MLRTFAFTLILLSCSPSSPKNQLELLKDYEGLYEYVNGSTLSIQVSPPDTSLYAIIDNAKYPLYHQKADTFLDSQSNQVVFNRGNNHKVVSYSVDSKTYQLISSEFTKLEMEPRRDIHNNPDLYSYQVPNLLEDGIQVGSISQTFSEPEHIINMVKQIIDYEYPDVHSTLIFKDNKLVLEEYFYGYDTNTPHQLRSATKVFYGTLMGIAIKQNYISSEYDLLLPYFENEYKSIDNLDDRKRALTIKDFLNYQHGLDCENNNPNSLGNEMDMMQSADWVKYTLDLPMVEEPGKSSSYCTGVALTLGKLIEITTGQDLETFARVNLFDKLGITKYDWEFEPNADGRINFSQLSLTPRDLLKWALLYSENGIWNGEQILPKDWVTKSFSNYGDGEYGYLWEHKFVMLDGKKIISYMASGNGGQKIQIWPELDMITIFTGGNYNSYLLYGVSTPPNRLIPNYILKATI